MSWAFTRRLCAPGCGRPRWTRAHAPAPPRQRRRGSRSRRWRSASFGGPTRSDARLGYFRGGARPPVPLICRYGESKKDEFGAWPICATLASAGIKIAPSTVDAARTRPPSPRARRDEVLKDEIRAVHAENYSALGARKMHVVLNRPLVARRHG